MTSQKMYVYFRHGKFENYSPKMTEWLLNAIDDIDPQLRSLEKKKKLGIMAKSTANKKQLTNLEFN